MNMLSRKSIPFLLILTIAVSGCGPSGSPKPALTPVTVQFRWTHQAQFAGFYAADQKGYYSQEGLAVTFIEGGPTVDLYTSVLNGIVQFGVTGVDSLIVQRADAKPLRAIATIYRRSPQVFVAKADSGISRPDHFVGKNILTALPIIPTLNAMMTKVGIGRQQYNVVTLPYDIALFASDKTPIWAVYINGSIQILKQAGYKLNIIYPDDYGVHFYADTIFTTNDLITKKPDLIRRFLRATLKGWTYAIENPGAVGSMVLKYKREANVGVETENMIASIPLVNTGEDHIGWMKPEMWAGMEKTLREQGVLKKPIDVKEVYTLQFLYEIYKK
jgi:NitT/TauT family transport system substrate-binding protein